MSLPIVDTPLAVPPVLPAARDATWDRGVEDALVRAPGVDRLIEKLRSDGALVVTTGQQAGLFAGPAYSVSKALSARALASTLERRWRRPVVPVFWVPGDDHDFDEVASVSWLGGDGTLMTASLPPRAPDAPLTPMAREPLGEAVLAALDRFEESFPDAETRADAVAWLRRHYRPEASVAGAFGGALADLLAPLGVVCLDSTHPAVKRAAAPVFLGALRHAADLDRSLADRAAALDREGQGASVPVGDGATLVFLDGPVGRDRLVRDGDGYLTRRGRIRCSARELEDIAARTPERLSANVLLRPVVESAVLPTVAYVAGPAELRYLELASVVYQTLGVPRQQPVARWSGLFVEPRVTRVLQKYGAGLAELLADGGGLETRIAKGALPEGAEAAFAQLRTAIERGYAPVVGAAAVVDPTLERPAQSARVNALHATEVLEKKVLRHAKKRAAVELAQVARARLAVRPDGKPQERLLAMAGFLARYGMGLMEALAAHIDGWYARALEGDPPIP